MSIIDVDLTGLTRSARSVSYRIPPTCDLGAPVTIEQRDALFAAAAQMDNDRVEALIAAAATGPADQVAEAGGAPFVPFELNGVSGGVWVFNGAVVAFGARCGQNDFLKQAPVPLGVWESPGMWDGRPAYLHGPVKQPYVMSQCKITGLPPGATVTVQAKCKATLTIHLPSAVEVPSAPLQRLMMTATEAGTRIDVVTVPESVYI